MHDSPADAPVPVPDRAPRWSDARDQMIAASALQEHIIANAPTLPAEITVHERIGLAKGYKFLTPEVDVDVHLHPGDSIVDYQVMLGGLLRQELLPPVPGEPRRVRSELRGSAFGCTFRVTVRSAAPMPVAS